MGVGVDVGGSGWVGVGVGVGGVCVCALEDNFLWKIVGKENKTQPVHIISRLGVNSRQEIDLVGGIVLRHRQPGEEQHHKGKERGMHLSSCTQKEKESTTEKSFMLTSAQWKLREKNPKN